MRNIKESFPQFHKDNARNLSILEQVFPLVKVLTKGGRVVQFSFERGHPVMRTFAAEQKMHPTEEELAKKSDSLVIGG